MKQQKGITLVALIITIVVLLILAAVTIQSLTGDNIIAHAQNAKTNYQRAQQEEEEALSNYLTLLNGDNNGGGSVTPTNPQTPAPEPEVETVTYTVTFDPNGGTFEAGATTTRSINNGSTIGTLPTNISREGYTFDGWFTAASGGTAVTAETIITENKTIHAHWTENIPRKAYTITAVYTVDGDRVFKDGVIYLNGEAVSYNSLNGMTIYSGDELTVTTLPTDAYEGNQVSLFNLVDQQPAGVSASLTVRVPYDATKDTVNISYAMEVAGDTFVYFWF